ncbi:hypothetical protein N7474_009069 [Penicillium riverlandense]|uniref:uncharacterized protein n=1 Tax=Penicillium riverlandense TaxID=1903569 RepID=UPI00254753A4|nr:uncharacterized protein N7474_009069 [Penicillium riverlandense]KAJ5807800.1 hypothetical protein N7474_009069 [Penicillium riverlandense]
MTPIQMIHIHYRGRFLSLLDSDDTTQLYIVKVCRETPQMELVRTNSSAAPQNTGCLIPELCTASFNHLSLNVSLNIRGIQVRLKRHGTFSRTYVFESTASPGTTLLWEADGALTGDFKLSDQFTGRVVARFRNKLFSTSEVGSLEMIGDLEEVLQEEVVISCLAVLVMVQSLNLATMVLVGGSP